MHGPVFEASTNLLKSLVNLKEIEGPRAEEVEPKPQVLAMLWLMARVAWEGQRRAQQGRDLTLHEVTTILREELDIEKDPRTEELIRIGVLLVLQADYHGRNDRILFGHKSFREFLVARYWASQLRRIVTERNSKKREDIEANLLGVRLLGEEDGTFDFLLQILDSPEWDDQRKSLVDWANDCFNDETPDFADGKARSCSRIGVRLCVKRRSQSGAR